jgi:hypothetical protein
MENDRQTFGGRSSTESRNVINTGGVTGSAMVEGKRKVQNAVGSINYTICDA